MKLQIAVDIADTARILEIADDIHDIIDIYEVGTPVIMKEGMLPVRKLKERYPDLCVLADSKIVDGGSIECEDICEAGADIITVLAVSDDETVKEVVETAHRYGRKVMADLICVKDITGRSRQLLQMGADLIGIHTGVDMQKKGRTPLKELEILSSQIDPKLLTVAGGVSMKTIDAYVSYGPGVIIAGGALYKADDVRLAVEQMKGHLRNED